jgi:hypothetical protein
MIMKVGLVPIYDLYSNMTECLFRVELGSSSKEFECPITEQIPFFVEFSRRFEKFRKISNLLIY